MPSAPFPWFHSLPKEMTHGRYGVVNYHPRTGVAHYFAYPLTHVRAVAVGGTLLARRLAVTITALR